MARVLSTDELRALLPPQGCSTLKELAELDRGSLWAAYSVAQGPKVERIFGGWVGVADPVQGAAARLSHPAGSTLAAHPQFVGPRRAACDGVQAPLATLRHPLPLCRIQLQATPLPGRQQLALRQHQHRG